ncbi:MAG: alpha-2-macroglobulin family protein [Rhodospirillales bacterium]|jgi:alpha-2-macroglobulin|nr:alpha-2-macroglobulin family protein [Rhodospirillales bacterium]
MNIARRIAAAVFMSLIVSAPAYATGAADFRATGTKVNADSDRPEFCVIFNRALSTDRSVRFEDFVDILPGTTGGVMARGEQLCVDGVQHGTDYMVSVRAGVPAAEGPVSGEASVFQVHIGNRKPSVGFRGSTYVLPRSGASGVPVISVNVDKVKLRILKIDERNMVPQMKSGRIGNPLGRWDVNNITDEIGELVWQGEMDVASQANKRITTAFAVGDVLERSGPGIYAAIAQRGEDDDTSWGLRATQWLVISDLGLTTFSGADGLHVFVRSLGSAKAKSGVTLRLFARNNSLLAEAVVGQDGSARFAPGLLRGRGGRAPKAIFALTGSGEFNFLDLSGPAFDLSDRGVGGRTQPGPIDAYIYADRGVFRPGETAHVVALLRDAKAMAAEALPMTLKLLRPDGVEARSEIVKSTGVGGYAIDLPFSRSAQTGRWTLQAHLDPKSKPIGELKILVEDVVPPRIEVGLTSSVGVLKSGSVSRLDVAADYLYGAPAAKLPAEGEVVVLKDERPYPDWPGYRFGLAEETFRPQRKKLPFEATDDAGKVSASLNIDWAEDTTLPLKAVVRAGVFELGGRPATGSLTLPLRNRANAIGLRPRFDTGAIGEGSEAEFDAIVLSSDGKRVGASLEYSFYKENWKYQWFRRGGVWDYEVQIIDEPLSGGRIDVAASELATLGRQVDWGRYRLEVFDPKTGAASSVRFRAGWFVTPTLADRPDTLQVVADKKGYVPGDTVRVHVKSPFDGEVLLVVANERIIETRSLSVSAEGSVVEFPFTSEWGVGAYVLATAFRPDAKTRGPGRAIGLAWAGLDAEPRTLKVAFDAPDEIRPRSRLDVPVTIKGVEAGKQAFVTLAAVDEGVLQLTNFRTPDPAAHFFGKRKLGVAIRDLYGKLIDGKTKRRGHIRSGGGDPALATKGMPPVDVKITSLFSGLVKPDEHGVARIALDVPDFAGRLRLMAVAFDATRVGSGETAVLVRDPLIAQASFPRFLAPGDEGRLSVALNNLSGPAGKVTIALRTEGSVSVQGTSERTVELAKGGNGFIGFGVKGIETGLGKLHMKLNAPGGFTLSRSWTLGVRPAQLRAVRRLSRRMKPGQKAVYSQGALDEFVEGTGELLLGFSPRTNLDVPGLLRSLDRYPYGCLEQTISRAMPLLYVSEVAGIWGVEEKDNGNAMRVDGAIARILEMQRPDGAFALWNSRGRADPWLTAYAVDFLTRAKAKGFGVPATPYLAGLKWLEQRVRRTEWKEFTDLAATAYAHYDLAAAGVGRASYARYFAGRVVDRLPSASAAAQLAAALALYGEADQARFYFGKALAKVNSRRDLRDYGSSVRDMANLVSLSGETAPRMANVDRDWGGRNLFDLVDELATRQNQKRYLSTQEQASLIVAAAALNEAQTPMELTVDGVARAPANDPLYVRPGKARLVDGIEYVNSGSSALWHTATITGVPKAELPPEAEGFAISRGFYGLDGAPTDLSQVRQNDVLVVMIEGEASTTLDHQALIVDLLPAGLEIENARLSDARSTTELGWLPKLSRAVHMEYRDDRFVAALDIGDKNREFTLAYLVRAVTPGSYAVPAVHIEDMYKPQYRARTAMRRLNVLDRH